MIKHQAMGPRQGILYTTNTVRHNIEACDGNTSLYSSIGIYIDLYLYGHHQELGHHVGDEDL